MNNQIFQFYRVTSHDLKTIELFETRLSSQNVRAVYYFQYLSACNSSSTDIRSDKTCLTKNIQTMLCYRIKIPVSCMLFSIVRTIDWICLGYFHRGNVKCCLIGLDQTRSLFFQQNNWFGWTELITPILSGCRISGEVCSRMQMARLGFTNFRHSVVDQR